MIRSLVNRIFQPRPEALAQLAALRRAGWIDGLTRQVTVRLFLLNTNQNPDAPYYESMTISHIFETGGYVTSQCLIQAVPKDPYPNFFSIALDIVWACSLLTIVGTEMNEVRALSLGSDIST